MTASQLPLALAQRHHNRQLFADRYLDETLPRREAWLALIDEAAPVRARVQAILAAFAPSTNETQAERDLVRPRLSRAAPISGARTSGSATSAASRSPSTTTTWISAGCVTPARTPRTR